MFLSRWRCYFRKRRRRKRHHPFLSQITRYPAAGRWGAALRGAIWHWKRVVRDCSSAAAITWTWSKPSAGDWQGPLTIPHTGGVHGIAFAPVLKRGFTSNGRSNTVSVFELDTLRVIQEVPVSGKDPNAIAYDAQHNHIITANAQSSDLSVLDAGTLQIVATVPLPGPPEFMVTDDSGIIYVNIMTIPVALDSVTHRICLAAAALGDPPPPTEAQPHPRRSIAPNSFLILVAQPR